MQGLIWVDEVMTCRLLQNLLYWQIHPHWYVTEYCMILLNIRIIFKTDRKGTCTAVVCLNVTPQKKPLTLTQKSCGIEMARVDRCRIPADDF